MSPGALFATTLVWLPLQSGEPRPSAVYSAAEHALLPDHDAPRLVVACAAGRWELRVEAGVDIGWEGLGEWEEAWSRVEVSWDGGAVSATRLRRGDDGQSLWWPRRGAPMAELVAHDSLQVRLLVAGYGARTVAFPLTGLRSALPHLVGGCPLPG